MIPDLELVSLGSDGHAVGRSVPMRNGQAVTIQIPSERGTHWYILKSRKHNSTSCDMQICNNEIVHDFVVTTVTQFLGPVRKTWGQGRFQA